MTRFRHFRFCLALAAGALALSATAARAEYLQYKLKQAMISSYSINGSGLDDMPAPPKLSAAPKAPQPALNGYANLTLNGTEIGPQAQADHSYSNYKLVFPTPHRKTHALKAK